MINNELLSVDNGTDKIVDADAEVIAREYYTSYAKYVLGYRALPSVYDGLKPVQRRAIYVANQQPQRLMKTAKLAGLIMGLHPHGDASIIGSLNDMAHPLNPLPLFTTKGNFGGVGLVASAARYTELYLSEVARKIFCQFIDYADYEVGEVGELEPKALPSLIPYCLVRGSEGIGVGLSTKVMPMNLLDLIDYYIDYIRNDGTSTKLIKPDVGYVLLDMTDDEVSDAVNLDYSGTISTHSIVAQLSNNSFLIEGLHGVSVDALLKKIDRKTEWISKGQLGFRDASTTSLVYVFEIYDSTLDPEKVKKVLESVTSRTTTYSRVLEEDGNAVYSRLSYIVKMSLECLNKAIDNKINKELADSKKKLEIYQVLDTCKSAGTFKNITALSTEQLLDAIMTASGCSLEVAQEVVKKPITYLTRAHDTEAKDIEDYIHELESHDRKKYLISLYKEIRRMVLPIYEERKHSIMKSQVMSNPCIKFNSSDDIYVKDGDGEPFNNTVYFVSDNGSIYPRSPSTVASTSLIVDTLAGDKILGFVTDNYKYIKITTKNSKFTDWIGEAIFETEVLTTDKSMLTLREDEDEEIIKIEGLSRLSKHDKASLKGLRKTKTTYVKAK